jgi:hypothetical protein
MMSQDSLFVQVPLSEEQLQAGLFEAAAEVEIPFEPIAQTAVRAAELEKMIGITFQESFDDLDQGYFAVLKFADSFSVMLRDYPGAPVKSTVICTDPIGQRSLKRLEIILKALHLSHDQLIWTIGGLE